MDLVEQPRAERETRAARTCESRDESGIGGKREQAERGRRHPWHEAHERSGQR
jgi:hypothetical protein